MNRAGQFNFWRRTESSPDKQAGGLGFATFVLGDVTNYQRYASTSTNAKEFQKRVFFYAQDTWRYTPKLTLNLGLRYELYWPETVNGKGNGALMIMNSPTDNDRLPAGCRIRQLREQYGVQSFLQGHLAPHRPCLPGASQDSYPRGLRTEL